jgi:predicted nucleic acid-binding protein
VSDPIMLDSGPLGEATHPQARISGPIQEWLRGHLAAGRTVIVPQIADYEVRRELLRAGRTLEHLDRLRRALPFLPIDVAAMDRAAELWALAGNEGVPTAPPEALDADVILAAQAEVAGAVVATANVGHLARFIDARRWQDIG